MILTRQSPSAVAITGGSINGVTLGVSARVLGSARFTRFESSANLGHATGVVTIGNNVYADSTVVAGSTGAVVTTYHEMQIYGSATPGAGAHWVACKPNIGNNHTGTIVTFTASQPTVSTAVGSTTSGDIYGTVSYFAYNGGTSARYLAHSGGNAGSVNGPGTITDWVDFHSPALTITGGGTITNQYAFLNESSAKIIATAGPIRAWGSNISVRLIPTGTGGLIAAQPDSTTVGGNTRGQYAVDWQLVRSAADKVAGASYSTIGGGISNLVAGLNGTIAGGELNIVAAQNGAIGGGSNNWVYGRGSRAGGEYSYDNGRIGYDVWASGVFAGIGDAQVGRAVLRRVTTSTSATVLTSNGSAPSTGNIINLQNNSSLAFDITVLGRDTVTGNSGMWTGRVLIKRGANAAATSIVGSPTMTSIYLDSGWASVTAPTLAADTTNGGFSVSVTALNTNSTRWAAYVQPLEVMN